MIMWLMPGLTDRTNEHVEALTADWAAEQAHQCGVAIAAALRRSS